MSQTQDITVSDAAPISHGDTSRALFFGFFFLCILLPVSVSLDGLRITPIFSAYSLPAQAERP